MATNLKNPQSSINFPMQANLVEREQRLEHWDKRPFMERFKKKMLKVNHIHDGPPFTNGDVHVSAALNKTLKDAILRYKGLQGFRAPYVQVGTTMDYLSNIK